MLPYQWLETPGSLTFWGIQSTYHGHKNAPKVMHTSVLFNTQLKEVLAKVGISWNFPRSPILAINTGFLKGRCGFVFGRIFDI